MNYIIWNALFLSLAVLSATSCSSPTKKASADAKPEMDPRLTKPEVRKIWVPDRINGEEYEAGHWKFLINKNSAWAKEE